MEGLGQAAMIHACLGVYAIHMISIPVLFSCGILELRRQSRILAGKVPDDCTALPTTWDYWAVRFFLGFVFADFVRGVDGMFDNEQDGTIRSVWGLTRCDVRLLAWWFRDICLFCASCVVIQFYTRWAETMLRRSPSEKGMFVMRSAVGFAIAGLAIGFCILLSTNRQLWYMISAGTVLPVNAVSFFLNAQLIWGTLPQIQRSRLRRDGQAQVQAWASRAKRVSGLCFVFNGIILTVFPFLIMKKILYHAVNLVPTQKEDTSIWKTQLPTILDLSRDAPELVPSPTMEVVEVALGWFFFFTWWPVHGYSIPDSIRRQEGGVSYVSPVTIGIEMRESIVQGSEPGDDTTKEPGRLKDD